MSDEKEKQVEIRPSTLVAKEVRDKIDDPKQGPPVDVNSDLTPITRQKITAVDAGNWDSMSLEQLHEQLHVMETRLLYSQQLANEELVKQVLAGVNQLKFLIINRTPDELKLL